MSLATKRLLATACGLAVSIAIAVVGSTLLGHLLRGFGNALGRRGPDKIYLVMVVAGVGSLALSAAIALVPVGLATRIGFGAARRWHLHKRVLGLASIALGPLAFFISAHITTGGFQLWGPHSWTVVEPLALVCERLGLPDWLLDPPRESYLGATGIIFQMSLAFLPPMFGVRELLERKPRRPDVAVKPLESAS